MRRGSGSLLAGLALLALLGVLSTFAALTLAWIAYDAFNGGRDEVPEWLLQGWSRAYATLDHPAVPAILQIAAVIALACIVLAGLKGAATAMTRKVRRHPRMFAGSCLAATAAVLAGTIGMWVIAVPLVLAGLTAGAVKAWNFHMHILWVSGRFRLAEDELNTLIKRFRAQKGRIGRTDERAKWYKDVAKVNVPFLSLATDLHPDTVSDTIIGINEKEMQSKRTTKKNCAMTAALLRNLYLGSPSGAREKIRSEKARGGDPYIAAGIEDLMKQHWRLLSYVAKKYGYPKNLVLRDGDVELRNWDVIRYLMRE